MCLCTLSGKTRRRRNFDMWLIISIFFGRRIRHCSKSICFFLSHLVFSTHLIHIRIQHKLTKIKGNRYKLELYNTNVHNYHIQIYAYTYIYIYIHIYIYIYLCTYNYIYNCIRDWNWDELEASSSIGDTIPTQSQKNTLPHVLKNGPDSGSTLEENLSHTVATLHTMSHPLRGSLLVTIALTPQQFFQT